MKFLFIVAMTLSFSGSLMAEEVATSGLAALDAAKDAKHQALLNCKQAAGVQPGAKFTRDQFFSVKSCMEKQGYKAKPQHSLSRARQ